MNVISAIYLIISPSGRRYVGSTNNIDKRWSKYRGLHCKGQSAIYNSLKKYGVKNHVFKILYECPVTELLFWESIFGDLYLSLIDFGGLNHDLPKRDEKRYSFSKEHRRKISESSKRFQSNPESRKIHSDRMKEVLGTPEARRINSERQKKRFSDPEEIAKQSERTRAYQSRPENRRKNSEYGKKRFEDPLKRQAASKKQKEYIKNNPEVSKKHSEFMQKFIREKGHHMSKKVVDTSTGKIFDNIKKASEYLNMGYDKLKHQINGRTKNYTTFKFIC